MEKICWANTDDFEQSEFVVIGIPDESQSHALRKGTEEAPFKIRQISNLHDSYKRDGKISLGRPFQGSEKRVHDFGNITRSQIENIYEKISTSSKIPISIGGDHSITATDVTVSPVSGSLKFDSIPLHPSGKVTSTPCSELVYLPLTSLASIIALISS